MSGAGRLQPGGKGELRRGAFLAGCGAAHTRPRLALLLAVTWAALLPESGSAQHVRVTGTSVLRYVDVRPLEEDSVSVGDVRGDGLFRRSGSGELVRCVTGQDFCRFLRSADRTWTAPWTQDLRMSGWGFGRGIRAFAHLRGRTALNGDNDLWPRSEDEFDALEAWLELARSRYRIRAGRLWKSSGLGFYNFDGASALFRPGRGLTVEAYGGWSLARGLNEARTSDALAAIESFAPDDRSLIVGAEVRYRPSARAGVSALYQREVRQDRKGLYSERLAVSGLFRGKLGSVAATLEADLALRELNEGRVRLSRGLGQQLGAHAYFRRYRPFFELWTIWGAFEPVGFDEVGLGTTWRHPRRPLSVTARGAWRWYPETHVGFVLAPIRTDGWRLDLAGSADLAEAWRVDGSFQADVSFGTATSRETLRISRELPGDRFVAASVVAFQSLYEFRVDEGTVLGFSADGGTPVGRRGHLTASLALYRHTRSGNTPDLDWSQARGSIRYDWTIGRDPGLERRGGNR